MDSVTRRTLNWRSQSPTTDTGLTLAAIGARIRELRLGKGLTLQQLGTLADLSPSMLSLVERGKASPSIATLIMVCSALDIHMGELLTDADPSRHNLVSRASEQSVVELGQGVLRRILREDRARGVHIALDEFEPDTGSGDVPVRHPGYEFAVVLEGRLTIQVDDTEHLLTAGDLISYESTRDHRTWNHGPGRARALWINLYRQ